MLGCESTITHFDGDKALDFFFFPGRSFLESDRFKIAFLCLGVLF
jgi:hypothetical protein